MHPGAIVAHRADCYNGQSDVLDRQEKSVEVTSCLIKGTTKRENRVYKYIIFFCKITQITDGMSPQLHLIKREKAYLPIDILSF